MPAGRVAVPPSMKQLVEPDERAGAEMGAGGWQGGLGETAEAGWVGGGLETRGQKELRVGVGSQGRLGA